MTYGSFHFIFQGNFESSATDAATDDELKLECGCSTPAPTSPPTEQPVTAAASCGAAETFRFTFGDLPGIEGCFQQTFSFSDPGSTSEIWSMTGTVDLEQVFVFAIKDDGAGDVVSWFEE